MKRSIIMVLALGFTLLFSFVYIRLFIDESALQTSADQAILYYLQVGAFENEQNAMNRMNEIDELNLYAEYYLKDSLYYVVTGFSLDLAMKDGYSNVLSKNGFTYYEKQVVLNDASLINSIKDGKYEGVMEVFK